MPDNRFLHHNKAFRPIIGKGFPKASEGIDGDFSLRQSDEGLKLYVKFGGDWYFVSQLVPTGLYNAPLGSHANRKKPRPLQVASGGASVQSGEQLYFDERGARRQSGTVGRGRTYIQSGSSNETRNGLTKDHLLMHIGGRDMLWFVEDGSSSAVYFGTNTNPSSPVCKQLYIDDTLTPGTLGDTYISHGGSADSLALNCGGNTMIYIKENGGGANDYVAFPTLAKVYLDGGNNTYIQESSADHISMVAGGVDALVLDATSAVIGGDLTVTGNDITMPGNGKINPTGHLSLDVGATKDIFLTENEGTYTPSAANHAAPKHYVDSHQMHSIQDRFFFDIETASRTYFRDIDSISYENKWDAYDTEDETSVGQTISISSTVAAAGLIVPYDCKLKGVRWVGNNTFNYNNEVLLQTWTGSAVPNNFANTTAVTVTLRDSITLTDYKRRYFNQATALDISLSAGQMIYPAFQYISGTGVSYTGSVIFLLESA